jgi:anti-anti-sigma factor
MRWLTLSIEPLRAPTGNYLAQPYAQIPAVQHFTDSIMKIECSSTTADGRRSRSDGAFSGDLKGQSPARDDRLITVVSICGEIDVSNVEQVTDHAVCSALAGDALLLDMTDVTFFGAHGLSMLVTIEDVSCLSGLPWALVTSPAVERVLYLSGQAGALPVMSSVCAARRYIANSTRG